MRLFGRESKRKRVFWEYSKIRVKNLSEEQNQIDMLVS